MAHLCHVRHDDAYLVVVLDPTLDLQWGMPHHVMWANPGANPAANDPILLQPTQTATGAPISRSEHEILVMIPPYKQLYSFLERRGVPMAYQGEIDYALGGGSVVVGEGLGRKNGGGRGDEGGQDGQVLHELGHGGMYSGTATARTGTAEASTGPAKS